MIMFSYMVYKPRYHCSQGDLVWVHTNSQPTNTNQLSYYTVHNSQCVFSRFDNDVVIL